MIKYFPKYLDSGLNIVTNYSLNDLEDDYIKYCKEYFVKFDYFDETDRIFERRDIFDAYQFLQYYLNKYEEYRLNSPILNNLMHSYQKLLLSISTYRYKGAPTESYSYRKNKTNNQLLFDLSLFWEFVNYVLLETDEFLTNPDSKSGEFNNELITKLETLTKKMDECANNLLRARKKRRLARNEVCACAVQFLRDLKNICIALTYNSFSYTKDDASFVMENKIHLIFYNDCLSNIISGPYYYCYLNNDEKDEITKQNIKRKKLEKNKSEC